MAQSSSHKLKRIVTIAPPQSLLADYHFRLNYSAMATVYAGTSGWAYPAWKPSFYPAKLASAKFLGYYATRLNSTEVNYTFRRFPTEELLTGWVEATPPDFKFAIKSHQSITHIKRLKEAAESTAKFVATLKPLRDANKLGPVLFQLPPFLKCDASRLKSFLAELPPATRAAFEFRDPSWFTGEIYSILRSANAALCIAESEKLETPNVQTADFAYLRLRDPEKLTSAKARQDLLARVGDLKARGDVFAYFKHEDSPEGAIHAEELLAQTKK